MLINALNLSGARALLAKTVALFHDVGGFEQFVNYGTYYDAKKRLPRIVGCKSPSKA